MRLIDIILNLATLLLWLNWRAIEMEPLSQPRISILSNLKKIDRPRSRWISFVAMLVLLLLRAVIYWQLGSALGWIPTVPFGPSSVLLPLISKHGVFAETLYFPPAVPFRADIFLLILMYSFLSFAAIVASFYMGLLLFSVVNNRVSDADPVQKLIRLHLGALERLPVTVRLALPFITMVLLWILLHPIFVKLALVPPSKNAKQVIEQAAILGINVYFVWKFFIAGLLFLFIVNSYVYLGAMPFWTYINTTGRKLLVPVSWIPLRLGKIDLSPLFAIVLVLALGDLGATGLALLYQKMAL